MFKYNSDTSKFIVMMDYNSQIDISGVNSKNITLDPMGQLIEMKIDLEVSKGGHHKTDFRKRLKCIREK